MAKEDTAKNLVKPSVGGLIFVIILSLILMCISGAVCYYGYTTSEYGAPFEINNQSIVPDIGADGEPHSYKGIIYSSVEPYGEGNCIAYVTEEGIITTEYVYEVEESSVILVDLDNDDYFEVPEDKVLGRALYNVPYIGTLLSFSATQTGIYVFAGITVLIFVLMIVDIVNFGVKRRKFKKIASETENADDFTAEEITEAEQEIPEEQTEAAQEPVEEEQTYEAEEPVKPQKLSANVKVNESVAIVEVSGDEEKVLKLEKAIYALKEKKGLDVEVEPCSTEPAGCEVKCQQEVLPIVAALIDKING